MRLDDNLDFIIKNNISDLQIEIPAMLVQPHIENAIKHGISNLLDKKGEVIIEFIKHFLFMEIKITDNGIGRVAASKISKRPNHISKGISLTIKKSEIFKKIYNTEITTHITDLYDENNKPRGTLVTVKIPFYDHSNN